jgi:hypothetical protein
MPEGRLRLDLNLQVHPLTQLVHGDDRVSFSELGRRSPEAAEHGDAEFFLLRTDLIARYALTDRTEVSLDLPYKRIEMRVDNEDAHHRDRTLNGLGDLRVGLRHFFCSGESFQLAATLGLSLPAGKTEKVTAASYLGHAEAALLGVVVPEHSHLRLGTGTVDPFLGVEALCRIDENWMLFGSIGANVPLYEDRYGYRTSPSGTALLGPALRIGDSPVVVGLFAEIFESARDRFRGSDVVGPGGRFSGSLDVPNTGRFEVAIQPTVTWGVTEDLNLNLRARIPVYTRIREGSQARDVQLTEPMGVFLGASFSL